MDRTGKGKGNEAEESHTSRWLRRKHTKEKVAHTDSKLRGSICE
jgi:hypothetical protein